MTFFGVQPGRYNLWVSGYDGTGGGWTNPRELITSNSGDVHNAVSAMDPAGNIRVTWAEIASSTYQIWSAHYVPGTGWGPSELLTQAADWVEVYVSLALDAAGNSLVLWTQRDAGAVQKIWARRHVFGEGWQAATRLDRATTHARNPRVAVDARGRAWAVWEQDNATGNADVFAARFE